MSVYKTKEQRNKEIAELKSYLESQESLAYDMIKRGTIKKEIYLKCGGNGPQKDKMIEALGGSRERIIQKIAEAKGDKELLNKKFVALFAKEEADIIYNGFEDDSEQNRCDFAASVYSLAVEVCKEQNCWDNV